MADADESPLSDLSELSEAETLTTDEEIESGRGRGTLDSWVKATTAAPAPKRKRTPSPAHEYGPEDNPAIAVIVMFRARFTDVFSKAVPNFGPQDIERGTAGEVPEEGVEKLVAALLSLCLNRKKDVEKAHYNRALDEAITTFARQWPDDWEEKNPLGGGANFRTLAQKQRISILLALVHWSLASSELVRQVINEAYKGSRDMQDKGQPMSVQPWGSDGDKRRYWLIEGLDDTFFRIYRENDPKLKNRTWWSVAQDIDSAKALAEKLRKEGSQASKYLAYGIEGAVPRWEAGEEKRKRREYRQVRKAQFTRPEPGFSMYEGRTRGKRARYNFSDDEEDGSDAVSSRKTRSGVDTPLENAGPTTTLSGRQVRARTGGVYGESLLSGQRGSSDRGTAEPEAEDSRLRTRSGRATGQPRQAQNDDYQGIDGADDGDDSDAPSEEWNSDQNGDDDADEHLADIEDDEDEEMSDGGLDEDDEEIVVPSKIVTIKLGQETTARLAESRRASVQPSTAMEIDSSAPPAETKPQTDPSQKPAKELISTNGSVNGHHSLVNNAATEDHTIRNESKKADTLPTTTSNTGLNTPLVNGIHKDTMITTPLGLSPAKAPAEALKVEELRIRQTPTPPLSDVQQSAPGS